MLISKFIYACLYVEVQKNRLPTDRDMVALSSIASSWLDSIRDRSLVWHFHGHIVVVIVISLFKCRALQ